MNRPMFFITIALIIGMAAAGLTGMNYLPVICFLILSIVIYIIFHKKYAKLIFLVFAALGMTLFSVQNNFVPKNEIRSYMSGISEDVKITGIKVYVKDDPESNGDKTYFTGALTGVFEKGREISGLTGKVRVTIGKSLGLKPQYGDILYIKGRLQKPAEPKNPGEFDYRRYLRYKQTFYTIYAKDTAMDKQGSRIDNYFKYYSYKIKNRLVDIIYASIPEEQAKIMDGLMLGNQRVIPADIYDKFKITGTVHILAVSGMNVGLIALFIFLVLKILRVKRKAGAIITLLFITVFAIITGAGASIVRATIMGYVVLIGLILEKDTDLVNSISIAAFVLLIINPSNIYDVGFQLSFLATFGIIYFIEWIENYFKNMPKWLSAALASTITAQLFLYPVMANTFHQVSVISILANIFIVPLAGMISIIGFAMWMFGSFSLGLGHIFGAAVWIMIKAMMLIVDVFAMVPYAAVSVRTIPLVLSLLYYIFFLALPHNDMDIKIGKTGMKAVLGVVICVWFGLHFLWPDNKAGFYALSARGINAALFNTQDSKKILLLGCDDYRNNMAVKNTVIPFLRYKGINNIDKIVLYSVENPDNLAALKRSFIIGGIYADSISFAGLKSGMNNKLIDNGFYIKEGNKTFINFSVTGADITAGDKEILFLKNITTDVEKRTGCVIYSCIFDKARVLALAANNICVINSGNAGFYRRPAAVLAENVWDLSDKGMFKYP